MLSVVLQNTTAVYACGEKLLVLGRGIRFQSRHSPRPASVLLYIPQSAAGRPLSDPNLESALKEAGHAVHAATTSADLESALHSGSYDVVLANITDAARASYCSHAAARDASKPSGRAGRCAPVFMLSVRE